MNRPARSLWWIAPVLVLLPVSRTTGREMVITVDDLPAVSVLPLSPSQRDAITSRLLRAFEDHRVPAIGFVNENKVYDSTGAVDPARVGLLRRWLAAGLELGNHTWSHPNLDRTPLPAYEADILRGERIIRPMLQARGDSLRYFRHPFLNTGRSLAVRDSLLRFLAAHGYQVAPVTIDNGDYLFAAAYDRLRSVADSAGARRVRAEYLDYLERVVGYYEGQAGAIVGRPFPQILLLHANRLNADTFDQLALLLERRGYRFIPLNRALGDPAYRLPDRYDGPAGISWLHRWALTRGVPRSVLGGEPQVPGWINQAAAAGAGTSS